MLLIVQTQLPEWRHILAGQISKFYLLKIVICFLACKMSSWLAFCPFFVFTSVCVLNDGLSCGWYIEHALVHAFTWEFFTFTCSHFVLRCLCSNFLNGMIPTLWDFLAIQCHCKISIWKMVKTLHPGYMCFISSVGLCSGCFFSGLLYTFQMPLTISVQNKFK